jgi:hypothetical protein
MGVVAPTDGLPRYRLLYQGFTPHSGKCLQLLLSSDGRQWQPYAPPPSQRAAGVPPNTVLELGSLEVSGLLDDLAVLQAGMPNLRFKATLTNTSVLASADAVHWRVLPGAMWRPHPCDPRGSVVYYAAPPSSSTGGACALDSAPPAYVFLSRPGTGDRRIALHTAPVTFGFGNASVADLSSQHLRMEGDAIDPPLTQLYGMPLQPYGNGWLGFLWRFRTPQGGPIHKYSGGVIDAQVVFGDTPFGMQRGWRDTLQPDGPWRAWVADGMFYPTSAMADPADASGWDAILVASASEGQHGDQGANSTLLFMSVPADRWVGLGTSTDGGGRLRTRMLHWRGGDGAFNARLPTAAVPQAVDAQGQAIAGFTSSDAMPLTGDGAGLVPRWRGDKTLAQLTGTTFALELQVPANATVFSLRGDYELLT